MSYFGIPVRNGLPIGLGTVAPLGTNNSPFSPASFFANGEQGWWYDPSNFATLFQDSAGTTPVTAVEQPVGLQLDLSKGLVLGPELVTNGSGDSTTNWIPTSATIASVGGELELTCSSIGTFQVNYQIPTTAGKLYKLTTTVRRGTCPQPVNFGFNGVGSTSTNSTVNTSLTVYLFANSSSINVQFFSTGAIIGNTFYFDNISVKELPGNHRFQTTSANRPVVSARVNLLTKTEDFANAAWSKSTVTLGALVTAPDGTTTAQSITYASGAGLSNFQYFNAAPIGVTPLGSIYIRASTPVTMTLGFFDGSGFDAPVSVTSTWTRFEYAKATPLSSADRRFWLYPTNAGVNITVEIWHPDVRPTNQGVGLPAYQRVNTSTDYDSTGFPVYIKPNGSNQFMQTNSINFTATDKMTVWQGVRKLANNGLVAELSTDSATNAGSFYLFTANDNKYYFRSAGSIPIQVASASIAPPQTNIFTGIGDISGDVVTLRVNGVQAATSSADQGTGNYGNYPAYFYMRAGTSLPFSGNDYGSIARGAASTAAQITNGETYINSLTKAFAP